MIPVDPTSGKALYIPEGVSVEAYDPKKKRRKCMCSGRGEWRWNGEIICSRCLIDDKLADQKAKVEFFVRMTVLAARDDHARWEQLMDTVHVGNDPPTLKPKGYWNLANIIVMTHRFGNRYKR
jgi:hypothetical protein